MMRAFGEKLALCGYLQAVPAFEGTDYDEL